MRLYDEDEVDENEFDEDDVDEESPEVSVWIA